MEEDVDASVREFLSQPSRLLVHFGLDVAHYIKAIINSDIKLRIPSDISIYPFDDHDDPLVYIGNIILY